jgi:hypothetical protein
LRKKVQGIDKKRTTHIEDTVCCPGTIEDRNGTLLKLEFDAICGRSSSLTSEWKIDKIFKINSYLCIATLDGRR